MFRLPLAVLGVLFSLAGACSNAVAAYPDQPIRLLVPAEAGGGADFIARIIAPRLSEVLGQSVIVENRSGASGTIAGNVVAKAKPDGYMVVLAQSTSIVAAPFMYKELAYDPLKDLAPVSLVAVVPNLLVTNTHLNIKSVRDLMGAAKAEPGKMSYGSSGYGSPSHLAGEMFDKQANVEMLHVPYKGAGPATTALLGNQIQVMFAPITAVLPLVKSGQLRALGVTTEKRVATLPDIPSVAEAGLPGFDINSWFGLFAPAQTPPDVIKRLNEAIALTLKSPQVIQALKEQASEPAANSPQAFAAFLKKETQKTSGLISANVQAQ